MRNTSDSINYLFLSNTLSINSDNKTGVKLVPSVNNGGYLSWNKNDTSTFNLGYNASNDNDLFNWKSNSFNVATKVNDENNTILSIPFESGNIGIYSSNPKVSLDIGSNDAIQLPVGDSSTRPSGANVSVGQIRYNSQLGILKVTVSLTEILNGKVLEIQQHGQLLKNTPDGNAFVDVLDSNQVILGTSGVTHFKMLSTGNIEIEKNVEISGNSTILGDLNVTGSINGSASQVSINDLNADVNKTYYLPLIENLSGNNSVNAVNKLNISSTGMNVDTNLNVTGYLQTSDLAGGIALSSVGTNDLNTTNYMDNTAILTPELKNNTVPSNAVVVRKNTSISNTEDVLHICAKNGLSVLTNNSMNNGDSESIPAMIINNNGFVGIGTTKTSETATLKVQGDVEITGSIIGDLQANTASASTLDINASTDLDSEHYLIMGAGMSLENKKLYSDSGIKYNPSTDTLTTTIVNANLNGNSSNSADKIAITNDDTSNGNLSLVFTDSGDLVTKNDLLVNSKISFNPSSETLNTNNITANKIVLNTVDGDDTSGVVHGNLNGNIITAEQSNITKLGTLSELNVNGTTTLTGELSVSNSIHLPNNSTNTDISTRITSTTKGTKVESVNSEIEIILGQTHI